MNIEKFEPTRGELNALKLQYEGFTIKDENDQVGYAMVETAQKDLKEKRIAITKIAKDMRAEAISIQKQVITLEKDLIGIIEPLEKELKMKKLAIDNISQMPMRKEECNDYDVEIEDSILLKMDTREYKKFITQHKETYYEKMQEEKLRKEEEAIAKVEAKRIADEAVANEKVQAQIREDKIKQDAEDQKAKVIKEAEEYKQGQIEEYEEGERKKKEDRDNKIKEAEKAKKNTRVVNWKKENNFNQETDFLQINDNKAIIFRKISELQL